MISFDGSTTQFNSSLSDQVLASADDTKNGASIVNASTTRLYLLCGTGSPASTTLYTTYLDPGEVYETPFGFIGKIHGIWGVVGTGTANVTLFST